MRFKRLLLALAAVLVGLGVLLGGHGFVFSRASSLCLSCMGLQ